MGIGSVFWAWPAGAPKSSYYKAWLLSLVVLSCEQGHGEWV